MVDIDRPAADDTMIDHRTHRLCTGVRPTCLALAVLVAATLSGWPPRMAPSL